MHQKYQVSVIIPNFNGEELLAKNLPVVLEAKKENNNHISEIIVVDDGSWDKSVKYIKENFPLVKLVKHKVNRGFSAAVNTGVRSSTGNLILLLNSDVIPHKDFLEDAIKDFDDDKVFAVSLHEKGFGYAKVKFSNGYIELAGGEETDKIHKSFYVSGGSGLFRRSIWIELGGMDEKLLSPFYWEDVDICYRALKRGYINLWEPKSFVIHKHESTISKLSKGYVQAIRERNQLLIIWKNIQSPSLFKKHIAALFLRMIKHPGYMKIVLMAVVKLGVILKERHKEIKESKISDETVFSRFSEQ